MINIYIASSVKTLKRQNGIVCLVIENQENKEQTASLFGKVLESTKNQAELIALKNALMRVKEKENLTIWTENQYIASIFENGWIEEWKKNGWRTAKGEEVKNHEELQKIYELLEGNKPAFKVGQHHEYRQWQQSEVEKRAEKYRKGKNE